MTGTQSYRLRTFGFPLLAVVYLFIALIPPPPGKQEIFPFFNWSLFSQSSDEMVDYIAIIHKIDGKPVEKAASFYDFPEQFAAAGGRDPSFMKLIDQFAGAIVRDDKTKIRAARKLVEQHYMREAKSVHYEIAIARYDPIVRYNHGKFTEVLVLGEFSKK